MNVELSQLLDHGKAPSEWVALLRARGIEISERTLRGKANRLGACHKIGRAMIITPDQIDMILKDGMTCPSKRTSAAPHGGQKAVLNTTDGQSPITTGVALAHLQKRVRANGAPKKKSGKCVVSFSATKGR